MLHLLAQLPDTWNAIDWWIPAAISFAIALPVILWANWSRRVSTPIKLFLSTTKALAVGLLALCLLEPMISFSRPEPGANSLVVLADTSQSLQIKDDGANETRAEILSELLDESSSEPTWLTKLDDQFELRRYQFDSKASRVSDFGNYDAVGHGSAIGKAVELAGRRIGGKPTAGIVLLTDGNSSEGSSDQEEFNFEGLPPVFPIAVGGKRPARDLSITDIVTSQTNFESAPVTIKADLVCYGYAGETVMVELVGKGDEILDTQEVRQVEDDKPFAVRFQLKPEDRGLNVFKVRAFADGGSLDDPNSLREATLINNQRTVIVDRGKGPFRILYVAGRPNWEYKFMRRALADDNEINLVGMLRVAKKEAKFTFRSHAGETTNPLYRGFGNQRDATAEQYDEPVMIRLDTRDEVELRDGFPKDAATLFEYDGIVLDDLEAGFFTQDQKTLIAEFVSLRGGGLLMLGGMDSFASGGYDRTPIGEAIPVYLDGGSPAIEQVDFKLDLTREGWVQPWVRIESTRNKEESRLHTMPEFQTLNVSQSIKPGATVLANVNGSDGNVYPALAVQRFGKGRTGALMIGDMWRWRMQTLEGNDDLDKSWRQTMRWLVSDVPRRIEIEIDSSTESQNGVVIQVQVNDEEYKPLLNADVQLTATTPSGKSIELVAEQDTTKVGRYTSSFVSRETGAYRVAAAVKTPEGNLVEQRESGWVSDPGVEEFRSLVPNRKFLETIAERTGGQVIEMNDLDHFASSFDNRNVPVTQTKTEPWWHRWWIFAAAISLLVVEWGSRRMLGLA
jgi:uncharacterized membrane protein